MFGVTTPMVKDLPAIQMIIREAIKSPSMLLVAQTMKRAGLSTYVVKGSISCLKNR